MKPFAFLLAALFAFTATASEPWGSDYAIAYRLHKDGRPLLVMFTADWCRYCPDEKARNEVFLRLNPEYVGVLVDFDRHPKLAREYGVTRVPKTFVFPVK